MSLTTVKAPRGALPDGYAAVPISADQCAAAFRVCVLVKRAADPTAGHLVVLRDMIDARVLLGCILDAGQQVQQWVELWIQNLQGLAGTAPACRQALSNAVLDKRWEGHFRALETSGNGGVLRTGWETRHPLPTFIDLSKFQPVHPVDSESGEYWRLCEDDGLLASKSLPKFGSSLHRYLYLPKLAERSPFVPMTAEAPTNEATKPLDAIVPGGNLLPLNPAGGLMLVRPHFPLGFEPFVDILSGVAWPGLLHGRSVLAVGAPAKVLKDDLAEQSSGGRLFMGVHGRWGRLVETFHLKLRLLADAVAAVRSMAAQQGRPVLNLAAESFQVVLDEPGSGLPFLWTAKAVLCDPGDAIALPIATSDAQYYVRAAASTSVYGPASVWLPVRGRGTLRIRQVLPEVGGSTILEGTFTTQERIEPARYDLIWLRLNLAAGPVDLYAHLQREAALAAGEWRFRTVGQRLADQAVDALRAAEGVPMPETPFEIIPLLSTACDLYGLGVLAVRTLLVDKDTTLPVALDETLSLARQAAVEYDESVPLPQRISEVFERDKRWSASLGCHRLTSEQITPEEAADLIPAEIWWDTLAMVVRMFPGIGPDSRCRDYGDAPPGGIHKVFDRTLSDLDSLLLRTRSLIVIDWRFNREIHSVIRKYLIGLG